MDLPKGHWMHAALAKEKARIAKKGAKPMMGKKPMMGEKSGGMAAKAMPDTATEGKGEANGYAC